MQKQRQMSKELIEKLWEEHESAPFPQSCRGRDVNDIELTMLDADIAGCVDTFVTGRKLNLFQTAVLGLCYRDVGYVIPALDEEAKTYYARLERLAELVLRAVAQNESKGSR